MNTAAADRFARRAADWAIAACLLISLLIFTARGVNAWLAAGVTPGMAVTSGYEEESIYALWRDVHGQAVYADPGRLPFASAYFNWLFYACYAGPVKLAASLAGEQAIPRAGRLFTALGALAGTGSLFWILRHVLPGQARLAGVLASLVFFGPLVGWWAHTIRPDVWALALETAALAVLLSAWRRHPMPAALGSCLLFYGAWSFKQSYFLGLGAALLFLVGRRQWRPALVLGLGSCALWLATLLVLGPAYRAALQTIGTNNVFYPALGLTNLLSMLVKCAPLWLLAAALLVWPQPAASPATPTAAADARLLGLLGLCLATPLALLASCKLGATSNYFFTTLLMLAVYAAGLAATCASPVPVLLGCTSALGLQLLVMLGRVGQPSILPQARELAATWTVWQPEPEPRFAVINALNQPWLNPGSPPLVLAFNYPRDRQAGHHFESDGIGGLIAAGYFRSLLLPSATTEAFDGGSLRRYVRGPTINGLTVFRRATPSTK